MKNFLLSLVLLTTSLSADAQIFSGDAGRGTLLGGLVGGIIGHNSNRRTMEGIGIGAGTGWLLGTINREHRNRGSYDTYIPSRRRSVYADSAPVSRRPNYAVGGAALGGVTGAIVGHNQNRQTLEGMAIGAATGLAVGGIAEHVTRQRESRHYYAHEAPPPVLISNSRFFRNPTPPQPEDTTVRKPSGARLKQPAYVFERVNSSRTSNRRSRPIARPVQQPQTIIINNYYYSSPPVTTNRPAAKQKNAGR